MKRKVLGKYIVIDPDICHGKPTFVNTRVMVWQVLDMLSEGASWDEIVAEWPDSFPKEAIVEVILLAKRAFLDHAKEYGQETQSA